MWILTVCTRPAANSHDYLNHPLMPFGGCLITGVVNAESILAENGSSSTVSLNLEFKL